MARKHLEVKKGLFRVEWVDATGKSRGNKEEVMNSSSQELMMPLVESAAIMVIEDEFGIILIHEDSGDGKVDYTVIPSGWYKVYESVSEKRWQKGKQRLT